MIGLPGKDERKSEQVCVIHTYSLLPLTYSGILKIHLRGETLDDNMDMDELAEITDEYTGSDLKGEQTVTFYLRRKETEHWFLRSLHLCRDGCCEGGSRRT
jgi:hypothetical protein